MMRWTAPIGDLPPELAEDVVRFYSLVVGIRHDVVVIGAGEVESIQERIALVEEDLRLWADQKSRTVPFEPFAASAVVAAEVIPHDHRHGAVEGQAVYDHVSF